MQAKDSRKNPLSISWRYFVSVFAAITINSCSTVPLVSVDLMPPAPDATTAAEALLAPVRGFSTCLLQPDDFALLADIAQGRLVPDAHGNKEDSRIALSSSEMDQWAKVISQLDAQNVPLVIDTMVSHPVFVAVFDGTWNDRDDDSTPITVTGKLSRELEAKAERDSGLEVKYYHGVGTRVSFWQHLWEGITGTGTKERADDAMRDLREFAVREGKTPHVYVIGFSRGAASARHFLNLAEEVLSDEPADDAAILTRSRSFALLFDTVATGQLDKVKLSIPASTAAVFHFVATRERRLSFPEVSVLPAQGGVVPGQSIVEMELPGAHANLGGGYGVGLEALPLVMASGLLERQGFSLTKQLVDQQAVLNMGRHNSDWPGTAVVNAIRTLVGLPERVRVEPKHSFDPTPRIDPVLAVLEQAAREIAASKAQLARVQEASRRGDLPVFDGLSISLQQHGVELVLTTNCPQSVAFDLRSRWLLLDGQRYLQLNEDTFYKTEEALGLMFIINRQIRGNFRSVVNTSTALVSTGA